MSVPTVFSLAVGGGLAANFGLTRLDTMHKGCADVCTVSQFTYGFLSALFSPAKRRFLKASERQLALKWHVIFAAMFCIGPYLGNMAKSITQEDFTPVFLVVRSCGCVTSMLLGYSLAGKRYSLRQVLSVYVVAYGAVVTTFGMQAAKPIAGASGGTTEPHLFALGVGLLLANLVNDAGSGVLQAWVFERQGKHVDEVVFMMSGLGTIFYVAINGFKVVHFVGKWLTNPTMVALPVVGLSVPWEFALLLVNFYGNWNAKKLCTWLNGNSTAVISSLVPMLYRIMSGILSTLLNKDLVLPLYTWLGIALVFGGSLSYLISPKVEQPPAPSKKRS